MKASILDLRRRMRDVLRALDQNEPVTILHRGRARGVLYPVSRHKTGRLSVLTHPAFGMWKERDDLRDVKSVVRALREGRRHAV